MYCWLPSATKSSTPVTVTTCGAIQFSGVNSTCGGVTVPSASSLLESLIKTSAEGGELSTMPNVVIVPFSNVIRPVVGISVTPAVSLS